MGMKKRILKAAGYSVIPRMVFMASSPGAAAWTRAGGRAGRRVMERMMPAPMRPHGASHRMTAAKGLGAAAMAAPLGWWLGRRMMDRSGAGRTAA